MRKQGITKIAILFLLVAGLVSPAGAEISEKGFFVVKDVLSLKVADLDDDNSREVILLTQKGVFVLNSSAGLIWKFEFDRPKGFYVDDINKDGYPEVIISSGEVINKLERGSFYVLSHEGKPVYKFDYRTGENYPRYIFYDISTVDVGGDGYKELVGGTSTGVYLLRDTYDQVKWVFRTAKTINDTGNETITGVSLFDSSQNENEKNILAYSYLNLYVLTVEGKLKNKTFISEGIRRVYAGKIRQGFGDDILVLTDRDAVYLFDESLTLMRSSNTVNNLLEAGLFDLDNDGLIKVVIGTKNGIYFLSNRLYVSDSFLTNESVHGLSFVDWNNDNLNEVVCASGRYIYSITKDAKLSGRYDTGRKINDFAVSDLENNGFLDAVTVTDEAVFFFENNETAMKSRAHELYIAAMGLIEFRNYSEARASIREAKKIFAELGDDFEVRKCDAIEGEISNRVLSEKINQASGAFLMAQTEFRAGNYVGALDYLNKSKTMYSEINDTASSVRCDALYKSIIEERASMPVPTTKPIEVKVPKNLDIIPILAILLIVATLIMMRSLMIKKK